MITYNRKILALFTYLSMSVHLSTSAFSESWAHYKNDRYGSQVDFPLNGFTATPSNPNSDGQSWISLDGSTEISVYGNLMLEAGSFKNYARLQMKKAVKNGIDITYSVSRNKWFVYSGFRGRNIVYAKATLNTKCSPAVVNNLYFEYPTNQKLTYKGIILRMEKSLKSGTGSQCQ